jgi:hypothetical protein
VLVLEFDVRFSDANKISGTSGFKFGDLAFMIIARATNRIGALKAAHVLVSIALGCIMRLDMGSHELLDSRPQLVAELVRHSWRHGEQSL